MRAAGAVTCMFLATLAASLDAKDRTPKTSAPAVDAILKCQAIADAMERLHCFDTAAKTLNDAISTDNIYVFDKTDVEKTQRGSFGLPPPDLFKSSKTAPEVPFNLKTTIISARFQGDGNWLVVLAEGGTWVQTDAAPLGKSPRAGMVVVVNKAALGSFKMVIAGQSAGRVRRIR